MLKSLYIKNYALIDSLEIDFAKGFSVITGETGAGKSIILGALALILGQRADAKSIKQGEDKCVIEGVFNVSLYRLQDFFNEREIDYADDCFLRREILASGKSRAFINDTPVTLTDLKELGTFLIDIHSQHQNLMLGDNRFQLQVVDILARNGELLSRYRNAYQVYKLTEKKLEELRFEAQKSREEEEFLRFQSDSLTEAALKEGEQEELERELDTLTHAEEIKFNLFKIHSLLSDDEHGVTVALKECLNTSQSLVKIYPSAEEFIQRLESSYIDLKDLSLEVERKGGDIEFSPERVLYVEERLSTIYALEKKHHVESIAELLSIKKDIELKLEHISSFSEQIQSLEKQFVDDRIKVNNLSKQLSENRKKAVPQIEKSLTDKVSILGMPNVRFKCELTQKNQPDITGADDLQFLFSANKNIALQPVAEIASGGEISRLMLCLKSMIAGATALPTIIFDEIDTGVSGEIADKMGQIMQEFGNDIQVIAITHLPQIAAKGKTHYKVFKLDDEKGTTTNLVKLTDNERLDEVARMLSGATLTDAAIQNAKVMLGFN